jgi:hypothetical protein
MTTSVVLETIQRILSPVLGENMARSAAQAHCRGLGVNGDQISSEQVAALVDRMGKGLNVFVGRDKAGVLVSELQRALGGPRVGAPS